LKIQKRHTALKSRRTNENFKSNKVYLFQKLKCAGGVADLTENALYIQYKYIYIYIFDFTYN